MCGMWLSLGKVAMVDWAAGFTLLLSAVTVGGYGFVLWDRKRQERREKRLALLALLTELDLVERSFGNNNSTPSILPIPRGAFDRALPYLHDIDDDVRNAVLDSALRLQNRDVILHEVSTRRPQTNQIGR